jgi:deazaflavin-dependent oxidoreductase (nitroreductase family)
MDMKETNRKVVDQFRAGGEVEGMHRDRLLLLTTRGTQSGKDRVAPMMFVEEGDTRYVIAANNGSPTDPAWYRNLVAEPRVVVEVGDGRFQAIATPLDGAERDRVWQKIVKDFSFFADYQSKVSREIPVIALTPA